MIFLTLSQHDNIVDSGLTQMVPVFSDSNTMSGTSISHFLVVSLTMLYAGDFKAIKRKNSPHNFFGLKRFLIREAPPWSDSSRLPAPAWQVRSKQRVRQNMGQSSQVCYKSSHRFTLLTVINLIVLMMLRKSNEISKQTKNMICQPWNVRICMCWDGQVR